MPKTRDAFALEYWKKVPKKTGAFAKIFYAPNQRVGNLNPPSKRGYLESLIETAFNDYATVKNAEKMLARHIERVNALITAYALKLVAADDETIKAKILRVTKLNSEYRLALETLQKLSHLLSTTSALTFESLKKEIMRLFGKRLKQARLSKNFSQETTAKFLGITQPAYSLYESGKSPPPLATIFLLARKFDVSTDWLLGVKDDD